MPLIDVVGKRSLKSRSIYTVLYILLVLGGITMVYPFLLMLAGSTTTAVDYPDFKIIPKYYYSDEMVYVKYMCDKYTNPGPNLAVINERAKDQVLKLKDIKPPSLSGLNISAAKTDWAQFMKDLPLIYKATGFREIEASTGKVERAYQEFVFKKYGDVKKVNEAYKNELISISYIRAPQERLTDRGYAYDDSRMLKEYLEEFKAKLSDDMVFPISIEGGFQAELISKYIKIEELNKVNKTQYADFSSIPLTETYQASDLKADWEKFVRKSIPQRYLKMDERAGNYYKKYLEKKYKKIGKLNAVYFPDNPKSGYTSFRSVNLRDNYEVEPNKAVIADINEMIVDKETAFPISLIKVKTTQLKWREFVKSKYKDISAYNAVYATSNVTFDNVRVPFDVFDWQFVKENVSSLRWEFIFKNYNEVISFIMLHGYAILNTIIYCLLVIAATLTVNPMCAYALSRFTLSYSNKVLMFLLATMAFPAEVAMIPNFLMIKNLHLLNTYWALILPGLASGFSIFILKGFFDSLPKEFYEAAQMDGASEMKIFWNITLPLAKPILAYLALGAFVSAYGAFMFALLVCQDPRMWTLMVWLYEMQDWAPAYVQMSALVLTSIPTLLIFLFAQRVIMRGVIIPVQH